MSRKPSPLRWWEHVTNRLHIKPSNDEFVGKYAWWLTPLNRNYDNHAIGYNREILTSLGLEDPKALFRRGEWDLEKFYEYCLAATRVNNDGITEQWGTCMGFVSIGSMANVAYEVWQYYKDPVDGKYKSMLSDPKFLKCLEINTRIFLENKTGIALEGHGTNGDEYIDGNVLFWHANTTQIPKGDEALTFDYGIVPYPLAPGNNSGIHDYPQDICAAIPIGVAEPGIVFQIMEELMGYNYGYEEESLDELYGKYAQNFIHEDDIEMAMELNLHLSSPRIILRHDFPWESTVSYVSQGYATPAQAIEERFQWAQDMVDEFLHTDWGFVQ